MSTAATTLYDTAFVEWTDETAKLLRNRRFGDMDLEHLVEEVEDLGRSERSAVQSQLLRMIMHLIKKRIQPERAGASWHRSIIHAQRQILLRIRHSPSLRPFLAGVLEETYQWAVKDAIRETKLPPSRAAEIPAKCPWTLEELLEGEPE